MVRTRFNGHSEKFGFNFNYNGKPLSSFTLRNAYKMHHDLNYVLRRKTAPGAAVWRMDGQKGRQNSEWRWWRPP